MSGPVALPAHVNDVRLVGRLAAEARQTELPSGDVVVGFRVIVERLPTERRPGGPRIDALECSAWTATGRRTAMRWSAGDVVEVTGRLRRRFQRGASGPVSRWEVEVLAAKRLLRADDAAELTASSAS